MTMHFVSIPAFGCLELMMNLDAPSLNVGGGWVASHTVNRVALPGMDPFSTSAKIRSLKPDLRYTEQRVCFG